MREARGFRENIRKTKGAFAVHLLMNPLQYLCKTLSGAQGYAVMILGLQYMDAALLRKGICIYAIGVLAAALCCAVDIVFKAKVECRIRTWQKRKLLRTVLYQREGGRTRGEGQQEHTGRTHSAGLQEILITDVENIVDLYGTQISNFVTPIVVSTVCIAAVFAKSVVIASIVLVSMALTAVINLYFLPRLHAQIGEVRKAENGLVTAYTDTVLGSAVLRVFSYQKKYLEEIGHSIQGVLGTQKKEVKIRFQQGLAINLLSFSSMTVPFLAGAILTVQGKMGLSDMMYITQLSGNLLWFINTFTGTVTEMQKTRVSRERIDSVLTQGREMRGADTGAGDGAGLLPEEIGIGEGSPAAVKLEHLNVALSGRQIIKDVSLEVPKGAFVAFVGESGCGKTTIFKALQAFVPYQGNILLFGRDADELEERTRYGLMSLVSQDVGLTGGTIRDNILIGRQDASDREVKEAAEMALVDKFADGLETGLDTEAGENGGRLSGGERQRVTLARGLIKDAPILLLDEVTSALDPETEQGIVDAVDRLRGQRTILAIAQKLNTIRHADMIFCFKDGEMIGQGTHEELMESCGEYGRLIRNAGA